MKFNGTIFSKPQQDQLKENIIKEIEKASGGKYEQYSLDLSTEIGRQTLIELTQRAKNGKSLILYRAADGVYYTPQYILPTFVRYGTTPIIVIDNGIKGLKFKSITCDENEAKSYFVERSINGTVTPKTENVTKVTVYAEA